MSGRTPPVGVLHKSSLKTPQSWQPYPSSLETPEKSTQLLNVVQQTTSHPTLKDPPSGIANAPDIGSKTPKSANVPPSNSSPTSIRTRPSTHTQGTLGSTSTARKNLRKMLG